MSCDPRCGKPTARTGIPVPKTSCTLHGYKKAPIIIMKAEEDIGDILDEIDRNLSGVKQKQGKVLTEGVSQVSRDVDELLDMTEDDMADGPPKHKFRQSRVPMTSPTDAREAVVKRKCQRVMVAGLNTARGHSTGMTPRSCDNLMCLSCDFKVVSFDGLRWSGGADYLFLRNNYPDLQRLRPQLVPDRSSRAYACGCSKASPKEITEIGELNPELKWVCMKH